MRFARKSNPRNRSLWSGPVLHLRVWLPSFVLVALGLAACQGEPSRDSDQATVGVIQQRWTSNSAINGSVNGSINGSINGALNGALNGLNGSINSSLNGS